MCAGSADDGSTAAQSEENPSTYQYFSTDGGSKILPLRVMPQELVDLVLAQGVPPHGKRSTACGIRSTVALQYLMLRGSFWSLGLGQTTC
jgi:hypothetical protein